MAVVTMTQWARIQAKAWLDGKWDGKPGESNWLGPGDYQNLLETDPLQALNKQVRADFGIREDAKLFDIDDPTYGGGTDESGSEPQFQTMTLPELEKVIKEGKLGTAPHERQAKMIPSEWISYPPLYTKSLEAPDDGATLSLKQWAQILAYLYRFKIVNPGRFSDLKDLYETDPATAVDTIVNGGFVKGESVKGLSDPEFGKITIPKYNRRINPLFRLGDPPKATPPKKDPPVNLQDILANPNGYARVVMRLCC